MCAHATFSVDLKQSTYGLSFSGSEQRKAAAKIKLHMAKLSAMQSLKGGATGPSAAVAGAMAMGPLFPGWAEKNNGRGGGGSGGENGGKQTGGNSSGARQSSARWSMPGHRQDESWLTESLAPHLESALDDTTAVVTSLLKRSDRLEENLSMQVADLKSSVAVRTCRKRVPCPYQFDSTTYPIIMLTMRLAYALRLSISRFCEQRVRGHARQLKA